MISTALVAKNGVFYTDFWSKTYLTRPQFFNTWALISPLVTASPQRLEVGPGLRPRLPIVGTHFIDISPPVIERLNEHGGFAQRGEITALPFEDEQFDLVAAFDVVEHVEDDCRIFAEFVRVLKARGQLIFSVPLHAAQWSIFDDCVGHARRYEPAALKQMLERYGLVVEKSAIFGMQSNNPWLLKYAVRGLTEHHSKAVRLYNWLFFPLGLLLQKRLRFTVGLMELSGVHEVLLVCRRAE